MSAHPATTPVRLRDYQEEAVSDFVRWVRDGERLIGLVSPTGSGKTVMLVEFLRRSGVLGLLSSAVIAVPMNSIERAFEQQFERQGEGMVYCPRGKGRSGRDKYDAHLSAPLAAPLAFLTTRQQVTTWGIDALPADLSGRVLVLDEAHHATTGALDTQVGLLRDAWHARGGIVLLMTATPFRTNGQEVLPAGTRTHVRTLAMHAASGHAPNHFQVQTAMLSKVEAHTVAELQGEALSDAENAHGESFRDLVDLWERDGRPKAVFIVPANGSRRWADRLIAALSKSTPRGRILDAVGTGKDVADTLAVALDEERNVTTFGDSKYDVIVSCKRFDEGTDWPLCSHVYNYGIPSSLGLILQRFGRATRDKSRISGHTHPDTASITFLVPKVADDLLDAMEAKHHRLALTLAILQEDWRLARTMGADLSTRLHDSWTAGQRRAQGQEGQPAEPTAPPERVRDDLRLDAKATLIAWQAKQEQATGRPATLTERHAYVDGLGLEGEKRRAMVAAALDLDVADQPEVMDFVQTEAPRLGYDFEAILRAVGAAFPGAVSDETGNVLKIMSAFTGQDVARVVERLGAEKPDLTEEMIVEAAKRYYAETGKWPTSHSGDASVYFPFSETWSAVDACLRNGCRGLTGHGSLAQLLSKCSFKRNHLNMSIMTEAQIIAAADKYFEKYGLYPTFKDKHASEFFDVSDAPKTWAGVQSLMRIGGRGLPGNNTLANLLDSSGRRISQRCRPMTEDDVINAMKKFYFDFDRFPRQTDGDASKYFGRQETWSSVNQCLRKGLRGLTGGSSIYNIAERLSGIVSRNRCANLNILIILASVARYHLTHREMPRPSSGDASNYFHMNGESWRNIDTSLRQGLRGLKCGSSLVKIIAQHFNSDGGLLPEVTNRYGLTRERLLSLTKDDFNPDGTLKDPGGQDPASGP